MARTTYNYPIVVVSTILTPSIWDYLTDALAGLNVRLYNYLAPEVVAEPDYSIDVRFDVIEIPFGVQVYYHGNFEEREWPEWQDAGFFRSRKSAEEAVCWFERSGIKPDDIQIVENHSCRRWELEYHPIQD